MCTGIPFSTIEAVLSPVTALGYCSTVLLVMVSHIVIATWTNSATPHYQQLRLPGFEPKVGYLRHWFCFILVSLQRLFREVTLDRIFWTLAIVVGCAVTTQLMALTSWIIYTYGGYCRSAVIG